jgi:hypothetical protein
VDTIDRIKKKILDGLVLDDQGAWVPITQRKEAEKNFSDRVISGKVLCQGRWVPLQQAGAIAKDEDVALSQQKNSGAGYRNP